jgi:SNF2-related domain/Helicase conserved C-terminal domain/Protein of unknown function (DUF2786)
MRDHPDLLYPDAEILRPWQPENIRGLLTVWRDGALTGGTGSAKGPLLASGMGLGKTATAIVAANTFGLERVLVIAPKAAIPDWQRELRRWHTRYPLIRHLSARKRWLDIRVGWVLVNYANVDRWPELKDLDWDLLIVDEAQAVKEPSAKRTNFIFGGEWKGQTVKAIPCRKGLIVSGTPLKNRPEELFTQLQFLDPRRWHDRAGFIEAYYEADTGGTNPRPRVVTNKGRVVQNVKPRNLMHLGRELLGTVLVRSHKGKAGLPPKHFEQVLIPPWEMGRPSADWFNVTGWTKFLLGRELAELRTVAVTDQDWDEVRRIEVRIQEMEAACRHHVGEIKAPAVLAYLLTLTEKTLVICHHKHLIKQFAKMLKRAGKRVVVHSGDYASPTEAVKAFQKDPAVQFFIGQVMASSLSLTLTAAHHVVFAELPPTRADFDQAVDRLHRISQKDDVLVTVFTIDFFESGDPTLLHQMREKKAIADQVLDLTEQERTEDLSHSGGGWDWRTRWVWRKDQITAHDAAYDELAAAWIETRLWEKIEDLFGKMDELLGKRKPSTPKEKARIIIQALRNKTVKRGATPGEAKLAAQKAKELMAKFGIKETELLREVAAV